MSKKPEWQEFHIEIAGINNLLFSALAIGSDYSNQELMTMAREGKMPPLRDDLLTPEKVATVMAMLIASWMNLSKIRFPEEMMERISALVPYFQNILKDAQDIRQHSSNCPLHSVPKGPKGPVRM